MSRPAAIEPPELSVIDLVDSIWKSSKVLTAVLTTTSSELLIKKLAGVYRSGPVLATITWSLTSGVSKPPSKSRNTVRPANALVPAAPSSKRMSMVTVSLNAEPLKLTLTSLSSTSESMMVAPLRNWSTGLAPPVSTTSRITLTAPRLALKSASMLAAMAGGVMGLAESSRRGSRLSNSSRGRRLRANGGISVAAARSCWRNRSRNRAPAAMRSCNRKPLSNAFFVVMATAPVELGPAATYPSGGGAHQSETPGLRPDPGYRGPSL